MHCLQLLVWLYSCLEPKHLLQIHKAFNGNPTLVLLGLPSQNGKTCSARVNPMNVSSHKERAKTRPTTGGVVQALTRVTPCPKVHTRRTPKTGPINNDVNSGIVFKWEKIGQKREG